MVSINKIQFNRRNKGYERQIYIFYPSCESELYSTKTAMINVK